MINSFLIWLTEIAESSFIITLNVSLLNLGYLSEGFLVMQHALDKAIMRYHDLTAAQALLGDVNVFVQRFPYPEYYHDYFFNFLGILIPLVILFIFSMNHFTLVQSLVWEKENRLKVTPLSFGGRWSPVEGVGPAGEVLVGGRGTSAHSAWLGVQASVATKKKTLVSPSNFLKKFVRIRILGLVFSFISGRQLHTNIADRI